MTQLEWINGGWRNDPKAKTVPGVGTGIDFDGLYYFQCMDFVLAYSKFLGAEFSHGNAIVLANPQKGWQWTNSPQPGDVFVRNAVFNGINYGDTGCVTSVTSTGVNVIQQNLAANLQVGSPPAKAFWKFNQLIGYQRRIGATMTQDAIEKLVSKIYRVATDIDATPEQANYWVERIKANNNVAYELPVALGADDYKGDPMFRYKGRHYDEDMIAAKKQAYDQGFTDGGGKDPTVVVNGKTYIPQ